ncbi:MAG: hypothetical protein QOE09_1986 [Ilumatobacteraceae bacterium]|jgi:hypothetical protein
MTGTWGPRIIWAALAVAGAWSIGDALDGRSAAVRTTVAAGAWLLWGIGVVGLVVPSTLGLTVIRMITALVCGIAVISWIGGASPTSGAIFVACAVLCALLVGGADFGQRCVQSSAYGDEHRFLLRPPAAFLPPMAVAGFFWVAAVLSSPLLLASREWALGGIAAVAAALFTWLLVPRFNALSRRWLVFVPAGVVLHDLVVLGETLMIPRADIETVELALAGTDAADFTGPASGHVVEIGMRSMVTALRAPTKDAPRGSALHVRSFIVAPTRPGMALSAARRD